MLDKICHLIKNPLINFTAKVDQKPILKILLENSNQSYKVYHFKTIFTKVLLIKSLYKTLVHSIKKIINIISKIKINFLWTPKIIMKIE
jgi:hypothetical protein